MKFHSITLITLAGLVSGAVAAATPDFYSGFHNLPTSVRVYHYKVPDKILESLMLAAMQKAMQEGNSKEVQAKKEGKHGAVSSNVNVFVLPQLYLFDRNGQEIFARTAASNDLDALLDHAFSSPVPLRTGKPLRSWLSTLAPEGKSPAAKPQLTGTFTVLEYWAPWCEYCFVERDQLVNYFKKHSAVRVNWITVDADFSKVVDTHSLSSPSP
ncbi:MAG: TlpA family protein disulfide reductase [Gammaproteobacteria bacterium]